MASFTAFLEVGGQRYPLLGYDLNIHQQTDSLGRPASPTLGGQIDCTLSAPGAEQPFLVQWMFSPTMQQDGKIVLLQESPRATLKTVSFFNAHCTGLQTNFSPGATGGGSLQLSLRISPQRVAVGAIVHDNNWPLESHGEGETFAKQAISSPNSSTPLAAQADFAEAHILPSIPLSSITKEPNRTDETIEFVNSYESRLATQEEAEQLRSIKAELLSKSPTLRESANVAIVSGTIDEKTVTWIANSSKVTAVGTVKSKAPKEQVLKTGPTANDILKGKTHPNIRAYDSEVKLCESILDQTTPESSGHITITSENEPCDSCEDVITKQMKELRPKIRIDIIYLQPYKNK